MTDGFPTTAWGACRPSGWKAAWLRMLHRLPRGSGWRRLALLLRKPLKTHLPDWVDVEVWGLKLRLRSRGNLSEQRLLLMPQFLDPLERAVLARELSPGDVLLDIGANAGVYSFWAASLLRDDLRIEAFEPDPSLCARLRFNLQTNSLAQVTVHECALGRSAGSAILVAGPGNTGENRVETGSAEGLRVRMECLPQTLDALGIRRIKALKIDVEGFECDVLAPLFETGRPALLPEIIICELITRDGAAELRGMLEQAGYRLMARGRLNGVYRLSKDR
jgi:FkbM family methyltransferase